MKTFIDYALSFYGNGGLNDMAATRAEVIKAIDIRLLFKPIQFEGDSVDREFIRDIILAMRG